MKNLTILLLVLFSFKSIAQAQPLPSVEKSIFGVQTGILGLWVHNESRLTNSIALRTEVGLDVGFSYSYSYWLG